MIHRPGRGASRRPEHVARASRRTQAMTALLHHRLGRDPRIAWEASSRRWSDLGRATSSLGFDERIRSPCAGVDAMILAGKSTTPTGGICLLSKFAKAPRALKEPEC